MIVHICGSGNVAWHFAHLLQSTSSCEVSAIIARNTSDGKTLAADVRTKYFELGAIPPDMPDVVLIAVRDDSITEVTTHLPRYSEQTTVVHTSGLVAIGALDTFENQGVLYPLQTLSKGVRIESSRIPLLITGNSRATLNRLGELARAIGSSTLEVSDEERHIYHLAAVFTNNFSNHMFSISSDIVEGRGLDFSLLHPLIDETARKIKNLPPVDAQTGPARRGDLVTIEKHLSLMSKPDHRRIYNTITRSIIRTYDKSDKNDS